MKTIGRVSFFTGPHTLGAEDNLEAAIVAFIERAAKTLDVAVQELESQPIAEALLAARARGVRVRIVLEGDYLRESRPRADPLTAGGGNEANRRLFSALLRAGIDARTDYNPKIFHQKFIVRDIGVSGSDRRAVLTGSTNFTPTGTHRNEKQPREQPIPWFKQARAQTRIAHCQTGMTNAVSERKDYDRLVLTPNNVRN